MAEEKEPTVQDLMITELLTVSGGDDNEMLQLMQFARDNGVPLTKHQALGMFILKENGLDDLANYVTNIRSRMTPTKVYMDLINKLTLADRIKGNAKLSGILKANANPANAISSGKDKG